MSKEKAIIIDIDGVILESYPILEEIHKKKLTGDVMWDYFHSNCNNSRVKFMSNISLLLSCLNASVKVVLSTSRNEKCRQSTEERLKVENFNYTTLYMRKEKDERPSPEVKKEHIHEIRQKFDIIAFIDDDLSNCLMAEGEGILALRKV